MVKPATGENIRGVYVARLSDGLVVAQYEVQPNATRAQAVRDLITQRKIHDADSATLDAAGGKVHSMSQGNVAFIVAAAASYPSRTAFQLLSRLNTDFRDAYGALIATASEDSLSRRARALLSDLTAKYDDLQSIDKLAAVNSQVEEVRGVMQNNVQIMLQNQDRLDTLNDQSVMLRDQSRVFQKRATDVKRSMCCQNAKMTVCIVVIVVIIAAVIIGAAVGYTRNKQ